MRFEIRFGVFGRRLAVLGWVLVVLSVAGLPGVVRQIAEVAAEWPLVLAVPLGLILIGSSVRAAFDLFGMIRVRRLDAPVAEPAEEDLWTFARN